MPSNRPPHKGPNAGPASVAEDGKGTPMMSGLALLAVLVLAAEPTLETTDLFEAGTNGYEIYRIPGLVATPKGTLLAYCEARKTAGGDWGQIDIFLRRSPDGGKTWEPARK